MTMQRLQLIGGLLTTCAAIALAPVLAVKYAKLEDSARALSDPVGITLLMALVALPVSLGGCIALLMAARGWRRPVPLLIPCNLIAFGTALLLLLGFGPLPLLLAALLLATSIVTGLRMEATGWRT